MLILFYFSDWAILAMVVLLASAIYNFYPNASVQSIDKKHSINFWHKMMNAPFLWNPLIWEMSRPNNYLLACHPIY